jgi:hypothetical protein
MPHVVHRYASGHDMNALSPSTLRLHAAACDGVVCLALLCAYYMGMLCTCKSCQCTLLCLMLFNSAEQCAVFQVARLNARLGSQGQLMGKKQMVFY